MAAIYERQKTSHGGSFASDTAVLSVAGDANSKLGIVSNFQASFAQSISRIYSVADTDASVPAGTVPVFYVGGRTQGQLSLGRVVGPQGSAWCAFYQKMGNVGSPEDLTFTLSTGSGTAGATKCDPAKVDYTAEAAVLTNVGIQVGSQDMIVNENLTMMFANLECGPKATG